MVVFPNCKINIGLDILRRRDDGFHEIETLMYPVCGLCDVLEVVHAEDGADDIVFSSSGLALDCPVENNLCVKAYRLMKERYGLGKVKLHLHKVTPFGAGLGGGSADAAYTVKGLDRLFRLGLPDEEMEEIAGGLGSDTPFFIKNEPVIAKGRGEILEPYTPEGLGGKLLIIAKPPFGVSTAEAYAGVKPEMPEKTLKERLDGGMGNWKDGVYNGFEDHLFKVYPELAHIKDVFYRNGALYASMSGSGSAVFGIFDMPENIPLDDGEPQLCGWTHLAEQELRRDVAGVFIHHEVMV